MKAIGIQISSTEIILVVLEKNETGITQSKKSTKFKIDNHHDSGQVKQFRDQVNVAFDSIKADKIGVLARNAKAKGKMMPSPISFKLEGVLQLYEKQDIEFVWPQSLSAYFKKHEMEGESEKKYQSDAFRVAYYLLNK